MQRKIMTDGKKDNVVILYMGSICRKGYEKITEKCQTLSAKYKMATLVLGTTGGDPHAGFRIARAMQCYFDDGFNLVVPDLCKSAGTLIAIGAKELIIADRGELGPLDVQVLRNDELFERSSGLDLPQSIDALREQVVKSFRDSLIDIRMGGRLSTRIAGEIATNLTTGIFAPIFAQIDPVRLGEMQRANYIGMEYGERLSQKSGNLQPGALTKLVVGYPSHGFVIDRKEAKILFRKVSTVDAEQQVFLTTLSQLYADKFDQADPEVTVLEENENEETTTDEQGSGDGLQAPEEFQNGVAGAK
jgi:hypothetical protein